MQKEFIFENFLGLDGVDYEKYTERDYAETDQCGNRQTGEPEKR